MTSATAVAVPAVTEVARPPAPFRAGQAPGLVVTLARRRSCLTPALRVISRTQRPPKIIGRRPEKPGHAHR